MRLTEDQLTDLLERTGVRGVANAVDVSRPPFKLPAAKPAGRFALGRLKTGEMNKTEAAYSAHLDQLRHAGEILWFKFEGVKLRLADNTFYTPDFFVMTADGTLWCHEVKGFEMEDSKVKRKVAASLYPFRFKLIRARSKKNGGGWDVEEF